MDANMRNFYGRVGRIEKAHESGAGFEAAGTLGMTYYNSLKVRRRRMTWVLPVVLTFATVLVIKAAVLANIGAVAYDERLNVLAAGDVADRIGAYVLAADPLTQFIAERLSRFPG